MYLSEQWSAIKVSWSNRQRVDNQFHILYAFQRALIRFSAQDREWPSGTKELLDGLIKALDEETDILQERGLELFEIHQKLKSKRGNGK